MASPPQNSGKIVIDLQTPSRRFPLEVDENDSVLDVKKKIQEAERVPWTEIKLTSNDSEMEDSSSVISYFGLYGDEPRQLTVHCDFPAPSSPPAVRIISRQENIVTLEVRGEEKVSVLKNALVRRIGLPDDGWMLSYDDWILIPEETLEKQGVRDGVTIDLVPSSQPPEIPTVTSGESSGSGFLERKNFPPIQDPTNKGEPLGNPDITGTAVEETESDKKLESDDEPPDLEDIMEEDEHDNEGKRAAQGIISMGHSESALLSSPVRIVEQYFKEVNEMQVAEEGRNLADQGTTDWQLVEKPTVSNYLEPPWYRRVVEQIPVTEGVLTLNINLEKMKLGAADQDHVNISSSSGRPYTPDPMGKENESEKKLEHEKEPKVGDVKEERKHDNEDAESEDDKNGAGDSESWKKSH